jgi:hypothetical protein
MPRIVLSLQEWQTVAHELAAAHNITAPPGLLERVRALLEQAHDGWTGQEFALELDEGSAEAVRIAHRSLTGHDPVEGQRAASVAEAMTIVRDHQRDR